jgi:transglutaminase superfamily protein
MKRTPQMILAIRAFIHLVRYDVSNTVFGFSRIHKQVAARKVAARMPGSGMESAICDAVALAACFYWRPVLCLQRSVAATLLLRKYGIDGKLVIGYRPSPFFSHAWVEVEGRVVNDSPGYKARLQVLSTV